MGKIQNLQSWYEVERASGRIADIKFFPGTDRDTTIERFAGAVMEAINESESNRIDITDETI